jgi:hypothetical protein
VLLAGIAALAVPALAGSLAGCADEPPDPLIGLLLAARADAVLADTAAQALRSGQVPPATAAKAVNLALLGAARRAHADALAAELGDDAPPTPPPDKLGPPAPEAKDALDVVKDALDEAQRKAGAEVPGLPRQRAALVGSIAACCAAYRAVLG